MNKSQTLTVILTEEKPTKNTIRFEAVDSHEPPPLNTVYVPKWAVKALGNPKRIEVTIRAAD